MTSFEIFRSDPDYYSLEKKLDEIIYLLNRISTELGSISESVEDLAECSGSMELIRISRSLENISDLLSKHLVK